ncbi:uncharacterized protein LOC5519442 [Nematostella vectensis]|uniref:uncharacterized protein LOC5519442 n=1 Tax=Nematostella vectensis TaxID=45351 RepID=UPI002077923F|nr:uncharacterized protein LOC5519442 [Nematostella vectensis]
MPYNKKCCIKGCGSRPDREKGIALHNFPHGNDSSEGKELLLRWIDFVQDRDPGWDTTRVKEDVICSKHFAAHDFTSMFMTLPGFNRQLKPTLKRFPHSGKCGVYPKFYVDDTEETDRGNTATDQRGKAKSASTSTRGTSDKETSGKKRSPCSQQGATSSSLLRAIRRIEEATSAETKEAPEKTKKRSMSNVLTKTKTTDDVGPVRKKKKTSKYLNNNTGSTTSTNSVKTTQGKNSVSPCHPLEGDKFSENRANAQLSSFPLLQNRQLKVQLTPVDRGILACSGEDNQALGGGLNASPTKSKGERRQGCLGNNEIQEASPGLLQCHQIKKEPPEVVESLPYQTQSLENLACQPESENSGFLPCQEDVDRAIKTETSVDVLCDSLDSIVEQVENDIIQKRVELTAKKAKKLQETLRSEQRQKKAIENKARLEERKKILEKERMLKEQERERERRKTMRMKELRMQERQIKIETFYTQTRVDQLERKIKAKRQENESSAAEVNKLVDQLQRAVIARKPLKADFPKGILASHVKQVLEHHLVNEASGKGGFTTGKVSISVDSPTDLYLALANRGVQKKLIDGRLNDKDVDMFPAVSLHCSEQQSSSAVEKYSANNNRHIASNQNSRELSTVSSTQNIVAPTHLHQGASQNFQGSRNNTQANDLSVSGEQRASESQQDVCNQRRTNGRLTSSLKDLQKATKSSCVTSFSNLSSSEYLLLLKAKEPQLIRDLESEEYTEQELKVRIRSLNSEIRDAIDRTVSVLNDNNFRVDIERALEEDENSFVVDIKVKRGVHRKDTEEVNSWVKLGNSQLSTPAKERAVTAEQTSSATGTGAIPANIGELIKTTLGRETAVDRTAQNAEATNNPTILDGIWVCPSTTSSSDTHMVAAGMAVGEPGITAQVSKASNDTINTSESAQSRNEESFADKNGISDSRGNEKLNETGKILKSSRVVLEATVQVSGMANRKSTPQETQDTPKKLIVCSVPVKKREEPNDVSPNTTIKQVKMLAFDVMPNEPGNVPLTSANPNEQVTEKELVGTDVTPMEQVKFDGPDVTAPTKRGFDCIHDAPTIESVGPIMCDVAVDATPAKRKKVYLTYVESRQTDSSAKVASAASTKMTDISGNPNTPEAEFRVTPEETLQAKQTIAEETLKETKATTEETFQANQATTEEKLQATEATTEETLDETQASTERTLQAKQKITERTLQAKQKITEGTLQAKQATTEGTMEAKHATTVVTLQATLGPTEETQQLTPATADKSSQMLMESAEVIKQTTPELTEATLQATLGSSDETFEKATESPKATSQVISESVEATLPTAIPDSAEATLKSMTDYSKTAAQSELESTEAKFQAMPESSKEALQATLKSNVTESYSKKPKTGDKKLVVGEVFTVFYPADTKEYASQTNWHGDNLKNTRTAKRQAQRQSANIEVIKDLKRTIEKIKRQAEVNARTYEKEVRKLNIKVEKLKTEKKKRKELRQKEKKRRRKLQKERTQRKDG